MRHHPRMLWALLAVGLLAAASASGEAPHPSEALAEFQRAWQPLQARASMRPLEDAGWKARLEAVQKFAHAREKAVPVLTAALTKGDNDTRVFAAQALALLPNPDAKAALVDALKDERAAVRLYALDALSMLGKVPDEEPYRTLRQKDANRDVRSHAAFAIERDDRPAPEAVGQLLRDYDLKKTATAKVGENAPDFTLASATGKEIRLSEFRGKKPVVLVFVYGDT